MRLGTKIGLGYGLIAGLMLIVMLYLLSVARTLEGTVAGLARSQFDVIRLSLILQRDLIDARDFLQKTVVLSDADYRRELNEVLVAAAVRIESLREAEQTSVEGTEISILSQSWNVFLRNWREAQQQLDASGSETVPAEQGAAMLDQLDLVSAQLDRVIESAQGVIGARVNASRAATRQAVRVSQTTMVATLVAVILIAVVMIRSARASLAKLAIASEQIAEGRFDVRLDDSGGDELADLARNFNAMAAQLAVLDEMKSDFLSQVSHDLKAPLASIEETTRLLDDGLAGEVNEEQRRLLQLTLRSSRRLRQLVSNVLDLTTIEAGVMRYDFRELDVASLLQRVVQEFEGLIREKELTLQCSWPDPPVLVQADEMRLARLFSNLLSNAVEHSRRASQLGIEVGRVEDLPPEAPSAGTEPVRPWCLTGISDSGPGVAESDRKRIFEKFFQSTASGDSKSGGSGLGLAIVREIAAAHQGAVWVESAPSGGSLFRVALPMEVSSDA